MKFSFSRSLLLIALITLLFGSGAVSGQTIDPDEDKKLKDTVQQILRDESLPPYQRFLNAYRSVFPYDWISPAKQEIYENIFLPFVDEKVPEEVWIIILKSQIYRDLITVYARTRNEERKIDAMEKAYALTRKPVDLSNADEEACKRYYAVVGRVQYTYGEMHAQTGDLLTAHNAYYQAISSFEKIEDYAFIARIYASIASYYADMQNLDGLLDVVGELRNLAKQGVSTAIEYTLYEAELSYYSLMLDKQLVNASFKDSLLVMAKKITSLVGQHAAELPGNIYPPQDYYNVARIYSRYFPQDGDSIYHYLNQALQAKIEYHRAYNAKLDVQIHTLYGEMLFKEQRYREAEKRFLEAIGLLASEDLKGFDNILMEESITLYKNMVEICVLKKEYREALRYSSLLLQTHQALYDAEKIKAVDEVRGKYETEKQESQIVALEYEKKTKEKILRLMMGLCASLALLLIVILLLYKQRKKNLEYKLYESALAAEMYQERLEGLKSNMLKNDFRTMRQKVDNLLRQIEDSPIHKEAKIGYKERLSTLDTKSFGNLFHSVEQKVTPMDIRYLLCFAVEMKTSDIALLFNIDPSSVLTVRYRIRKKFSGHKELEFLL